MSQEAMNPQTARKLLEVGEAFRIPGPFFSYEEIKMGNVNHTYKVNYIVDDGTGMAPELLARVSDPFTTTRTTRKVGLGLPLCRAIAEALCEADPAHAEDFRTRLTDYLAELTALGLTGARMDDAGNVIATLPASVGVTAPVLALIAHMDTSPDAPGENVQPRVVLYQGGDLPLSDTVSLTESLCPGLSAHAGEELIVTDGTTLLGADDKAGVAEIVTACEYLLAHPEIPHRTVAVCFTPDEEVGKGADHFDPAKFPAKTAYTVDGGELGEIEYENFNAAAVTLTVHGVNIHPGSAKDKMKNAAVMAQAFMDKGYKIISNGTDNHCMLIDLRTKFPELTGKVAEKVLVEADITVNKNMVPFDSRSPFQTSGIRIGTPAITTRGAKEDLMLEIVEMIDTVLAHPEDGNIIKAVREKVNQTMKSYPIFAY